jgi:hypothetical protein
MEVADDGLEHVFDDYFRVADNTPRASYFASRNHVSSQREHLSRYPTSSGCGGCGGVEAVFR